MTDGRVRVAILDDRRLVAEGLQVLLARQIGISVVTDAADGPGVVWVIGQTTTRVASSRQVTLAEAADVLDLVRRIRAAALQVAPAQPVSVGTPLTDRELSVLNRVRQGESAREIALGLGISPRTVERHKQNIVLKLEAATMTDALRMVADRRRAS